MRYDDHESENASLISGTAVRPDAGYVPAYKQSKYKLATPGAEAEEESPYMAFQNKQIRNGFVRKVFAILAMQLALTIGGVAAMVTTESVVSYVQRTPALFWVAWVVTVLVLSALVCCTECRRHFPLNYVLLFVFVSARAMFVVRVGRCATWTHFAPCAYQSHTPTPLPLWITDAMRNISHWRGQ